jgi:hypothetical protein
MVEFFSPSDHQRGVLFLHRVSVIRVAKAFGVYCNAVFALEVSGFLDERAYLPFCLCIRMAMSFGSSLGLCFGNFSTCAIQHATQRRVESSSYLRRVGDVGREIRDLVPSAAKETEDGPSS